ncbi:chitin deacetylase, partial [Mortierella alpina]
CNTPGQIALTYSEGPSEATTQMLEILKEAKARVTFFANATWLEYMQYAGVTRRAYNDGHLIGMTYRLPNDSSKSMTDAQLKADIAKQANKIYELIGKYPKYVRLHDAGLKDPKLEPTIRAMGYTLVGFNLDESDYKFNTREQAPQIADVYEQTFVKQADAFGRKGSYVVVGYDIPASGAAAALPDVISSIIRNEYDMVRLDGCNNDNKPYKRSPMLNDGFVADDFSFGGTKYVHGQSPVAVQNGIAVPGQMPSKIGGGGARSAKSSGSSSSSIVPNLFGMAMAVLVALAL